MFQNGYGDNPSAQIQQLANKQWNDFLYRVSPNPWSTAAISGGTINDINGSALHPGILAYISSTSANSGFRVVTSILGLMLGGGEKTTVILQTSGTLTGVTRRFGFHNTNDITAPSQGVYVKINDGVLTGQCVKDSIISTTASNYTLSANTFYRLVVQLSADGSTAIFTLYADNSNTVLWSDTLTTNIPINKSLGHGDVCTYSGTTATTIGFLDYLDIVLPNARRV